jgi:hypothetical protein
LAGFLSEKIKKNKVLFVVSFAALLYPVVNLLPNNLSKNYSPFAAFYLYQFCLFCLFKNGVSFCNEFSVISFLHKTANLISKNIGVKNTLKHFALLIFYFVHDIDNSALNFGEKIMTQSKIFAAISLSATMTGQLSDLIQKKILFSDNQKL